MDTPAHYPTDGSTGFQERFAEFIEGFARIGAHSKLFPKKCHTCGRVFVSFPEYMHLTNPVKHAMEDCKSVMKRPYTMQYQNCVCGTTLILVFTEEVYPDLDRLWEALRNEAKRVNVPLKAVVAAFCEQCAEYIGEQHIPSAPNNPVPVEEPVSPEEAAESAPSHEETKVAAGPLSGFIRGIGSLFGRKEPSEQR